MSGGVERSTWTLYQSLHKWFLYDCYVLYNESKFEITNPQDTITQIPHGDIRQQVNFIHEYVVDHQIQVIIVQGVFDKLSSFFQAVQGKIPIVYVFRGEPAFPYKTWTIEYIRSLMQYRGLTSWGRRRILKLPLRKLRMRYELYQQYQQINRMSDYFVFLSEKYVTAYQWYSLKNVATRSFVIPNTISYENPPQESIIEQKQNHAVLVTRFEEYTKRIIAALQIWNEVQNLYHLTDWTLDIVGDGEDKDMYECYLKKHPTGNIIFHGYQEPTEYYKRASISILTSRSEAFANVLVEAKQFGCVPVAFDSYAAVSDIITHPKDGILIKNGDIHAFAKALYELATDKERRIAMAHSAMLSINKFSRERIMNMWNEMLLQIIKDQTNKNKDSI